LTSVAGSLTVVGTGIEFLTQLTAQARDAISRADDVHYLAADPATGTLLESLNPHARSLAHLYRAGVPRTESYSAIVEEILASVRAGRRVCAAFYGHPGVLVHPGHEAIRRARAEGHSARMLPGISAEACLVADLGVDPGRTGWQSYEATDFVLYRRRIDSTAALVLWQVGGLADPGYPLEEPTPERRQALIDALCESGYQPGHGVVLYEASRYAVCRPVIRLLQLGELATAPLPTSATLYVPPARLPERNVRMAQRLGM
jgi:precorrin-6B methylase 1